LRDGDLVERILDGDSRAGERLVSEHYPRLYRLLYHLTGDVEVAQDLAQQAFVRAWQALATFRRNARLSPWLNQIAYHEYTHWLRARRPHVPLEEAAETPDPRAAGALEDVVARGALAQLSPEHRETFLLFHLQGLSLEEVAFVLEIPVGTVKSRLHGARRRLREAFGAAEEVRHHDMPTTEPKHECP
jgi:RNA polymerase sigma-70 factor (ECF subfamily)